MNTLTLCSANQACDSWMLSLISVKVRNVDIKVTLQKHHIQMSDFHIWKRSRSELKMSDEMSETLYRLSSKNQICVTFEREKKSDLSHIQLWSESTTLLLFQQSRFHSSRMKEFCWTILIKSLTHCFCTRPILTRTEATQNKWTCSVLKKILANAHG